MKIKIVKFIDNELIEFSSTMGNGIAKLSNENKSNIVTNMLYDAEFDFDASMSLASNTKKVSKTTPILTCNNENEILGKVENIDDEGEVYLRLSDDCAFPIYSKDSEIHEGDYVLFTVSPLKTSITIVGW
jgi:hypothetical protein